MADVSTDRAAAAAGAANDVLAHRQLDGRLAERGILYVPDFVANAGGVVQIHAGRAGWDEAGTEAAVLRIGERVEGMLRRASAEGCTPLEVAERVASERIGRTVRIPAWAAAPRRRARTSRRCSSCRWATRAAVNVVCMVMPQVYDMKFT